MADVLTLPMLAQRRRLSLDALRSFIRRRPELRKLGVKLGAARAYTGAEADVIASAFKNRHAKPAAVTC